MPFIQRVIEPVFLSRTSLQNENGDLFVTDCELEAVTNNTLSNALRQLASLVLVANDIFRELTKELQKVSDRSTSLKLKIGLVEDALSGYDPKTVTVPEGDISSFALLRNHFERKQTLATGLFQAETRPSALQALYEAAAKTPVHAMRQMDRWRRDGHRSSRFFLCTPVLGAKRRKIRSRVDIDIETRVPAVVGELRRWTSSEAIGDVTVTPDCINRITSNTTSSNPVPATEETDITDAGATSGDDEGIDHKLPSPEEQLQVLALKFPAEIVAVDVSGRRFDRMSVQRRSLLHTETTYEEEDEGGSTVRRRTRTRKPRGKRRNTLAGTDQKEIVDALAAGDAPTSTALHGEPELPDIGAVMRSRSTDILRSKKGSPPDGKKSHFNSLKQWGKSRLKLMNRSTESKSTADTAKIDDIDDVNIYETVTMRRRKNVDKSTKSAHERKTSYSSSEKSSSISLPMATPISAAMNIAVKLRASSVQRRQRRNKDEQHSSSGNWSASSESGRASIGSEITNTTATTHPKSTTPTTTSTNSLNQQGPPGSINSRRRFPNTSTSSSVTSEGTLTPDIIHDIQDDGETSSVYSCDTEGYYTSFHMDSGLKTLKEEELNAPMTPLHTTSAFSNSSGNSTVLTAENEYELFGKGSTSTTTSSAGTVCTTLRAAESSRSLMVGPAVPERKSSLSTLDGDRSASNSLEREFSTSDKTGTVKRSPANNKAMVVAVVHKQSAGDVSPDSGHNTSSSPIESISSPNGAPSCSEFEFSESSDLEGVERIERIRIKTTINSSRIPSMCVITPPQSDDESVQSVQNFECTIPHKSKSFANNSSTNNLNIPDLGSKNANRQKLNLPLAPTETDLDTLTFADSENTDGDLPVKSRIILGPINGSNKMQLINVNPSSGYATIETVDSKTRANRTSASTPVRVPSPSGGNRIAKEPEREAKSPPSQPIKKATLQPLNSMFGKLRLNLSNLTSKKEKSSFKYSPNTDDMLDSGDYVTIADVRNNNEKVSLNTEVHYANAIVKKDAQLPVNSQTQNTEYISLTELPTERKQTDEALNGNRNEASSLERNRRQGARVTLDAEGKVVYSSDSLKRRKSAHTTFEPGPFVKNVSTPTASPQPTHRIPPTIRPVLNSHHVQQCNSAKTDAATVTAAPPVHPNHSPPVQSSTQPSVDAALRPLSPQLNKVVIRANPKTSSGLTSPTADCVRMPPATIVTPTARPMSPKLPNAKGAYVHMQEDRGRSVSPAHEEERALFPYKNHQNMHPQPADQYFQSGFPMEYHQQQDGFLMHRNSPMYRTLPSRMINRNTQETTRSTTPDITRDLNSRYTAGKQSSNDIYDNKHNYGFSSLPRKQQILERPMFGRHAAEQQRQPASYQHTVPVPQTQSFHRQSQVPFNVDANTKNVQNFHYSTPNKTDPAAASRISMGISNFFSPIPKTVEPYRNDSLKISPIDPRNSGSFKSSTPAKPSEPNAAVNLSNKLLSPKKSTMTNDELYAMIHKSKKKLNIRTEDGDRRSPVPSAGSLSPCNSMKSLSGRTTPVKQPETGYLIDARNRNSWSPNDENCSAVGRALTAAEPGSRQSWACSDRIGPKQTSRLDFKKLLLQHGSKSTMVSSPTNRVSAVEQLKLTKNQPVAVKPTPPMSILDLSSSPRSLVNRKLANVAPGSPNKTPEKQRPASKLLSPRANWRFANPRSDVLSSTILEDCREDESSNSSLEKGNSTRRSPKVHDNKYFMQNSIAPCNTSVAADKTMQKPGFRQTSTSENNNVHSTTRVSAIRAHQQLQRAEFFKNNMPPVVAAACLPGAARPSAPSSTLETAL